MSTVTLNWIDPTADVNGDPLTAAQINISVFDSASATPTVPIGTVAGGVQTFTSGSLTPGVHTFTVTATDTAGQSGASNALPLTIPVTLAVPNPPTNLTGVVNP